MGRFTRWMACVLIREAHWAKGRSLGVLSPAPGTVGSSMFARDPIPSLQAWFSQRSVAKSNRGTSGSNFPSEAGIRREATLQRVVPQQGKLSPGHDLASPCAADMHFACDGPAHFPFDSPQWVVTMRPDLIVKIRLSRGTGVVILGPERAVVRRCCWGKRNETAIAETFEFRQVDEFLRHRQAPWNGPPDQAVK